MLTYQVNWHQLISKVFLNGEKLKEKTKKLEECISYKIKGDGGSIIIRFLKDLACAISKSIFCKMRLYTNDNRLLCHNMLEMFCFIEWTSMFDTYCVIQQQ